ncbi:hypothetical protein [Streptomyces sp. NPDC007355]|uniref:hypothetical protein n=1 Tax=Streptomyces sp. NPDC007355 TaxID=3364778 RepID=UPI003675B93C
MQSISLIDAAVRQAMKSQCRYRLGAVLATGNRILAAAPNIRRNSPTVDFRHATFHAEEAVLRRVRHAAGSTIYVARVDAQGHPRMARPCPRCQKALAQSGVTNVFYTTNSAGIQRLSLDVCTNGYLPRFEKESSNTHYLAPEAGVSPKVGDNPL